MATAKATLTLTPEELRLIQAALLHYSKTIDAEIAVKDLPKTGIARQSLLRIDYKNTVQLWKDLS